MGNPIGPLLIAFGFWVLLNLLAVLSLIWSSRGKRPGLVMGACAAGLGMVILMLMICTGQEPGGGYLLIGFPTLLAVISVLWCLHKRQGYL